MITKQAEIERLEQELAAAVHARTELKEQLEFQVAARRTCDATGAAAVCGGDDRRWGSAYGGIMRNLSLVPVVGVGIVAIALVAHVWMFDAVGDHVPADALATTPAFAQHVPHAAPGCAGGMSACEVPMPDDPRSAVPLSALVGCVWFLGVACMNLRAARAPSGSATDRAPPRPSTASSVVLRV